MPSFWRVIMARFQSTKETEIDGSVWTIEREGTYEVWGPEGDEVTFEVVEEKVYKDGVLQQDWASVAQLLPSITSEDIDVDMEDVERSRMMDQICGR
jgi:hypothetical protein